MSVPRFRVVALRIALSCVLAAALACSSGSSPRPTDGGSGNGTGSGEGGGSGGGPGNGGTGGGGGQTDGGSGAGTGDGGTGGGSATVTIERLDASGDCAGLLPDSIPEPVTVSRSIPGTATCLGGTADGTGSVAVGARDGNVTSWQVFGPDGAARNTFSGDGLDVPIREPEGWQGAVATRDSFGSVIQLDHVWFGADGSQRARHTVSVDPADFSVSSWRVAADPLGGCLVAVGETAISGNHWSNVISERFDAQGSPLSAPTGVVDALDSPTVDFFSAGVSNRGDGLVTWRTPGTFNWAWLAPDGSRRAAGSESQLQLGLTLQPLRFEPLLDGSLALRVDADWAWLLNDLATQISPAPDWLRSRPGTTPRFTRGSRGYAMMPPPSQSASPCDQRVEILAPSGRLCGTLTFNQGADPCTTGTVEQGWDGTVVQQSARDACAGGSCSCSVRFWPRLLAAP